MNVNLSFIKNTLQNQFLLETIIATKQCKAAQHSVKWEEISFSEERDDVEI